MKAIDIGGRTPPNNREAEEAVLSATLASSRAVDDVFAMRPALSSAHFYIESNRKIFEGIEDMHARREVIDVTTIARWLKDRDRLSTLGDDTTRGMGYLARLVDATPAVMNVVAHAGIVQSKARLRRALDEMQSLIAEGYSDHGDDDEFVEGSRERIELVTTDEGGRAAMSWMSSAVEERSAEIDLQWQGKREPWGLSLPWSRLRRSLFGLALGSVTFVAALEGGGKSVFAQQAAMHLAGRTYLGEPIGCLFFSMEMPKRDVINRALIHYANQDPRVGLTWAELQTGYAGGHVKRSKGEVLEGEPLDGFKIGAIDVARTTLRELPFLIEAGRQTITGIRTATRAAAAMMRERGVRLRCVVIDHAHLLRLDDQRGSHTEALGESINGFKELALEHDVAVISPVQLTQEAARREGPIVVGDIRDASAIKQIGDNVVLIDVPYLKIGDKSTEKARAFKGRAKFINGKVRNNSAGEVPVLFDGARFRFDEDDTQDE